MWTIRDFLLELCNTPSPHGREYLCRNVLDKYFDPICDGVELCGNGSVIFRDMGIEKGGIKVMVDAHLDEIAFIVTEIVDGGFIRFTTVGAINATCLAARSVVIYGIEPVYGTIGLQPKFTGKNSDAILIEDLFIDTGLSSAALKKLVPLGSLVVADRSPIMLCDDVISARGLDNKAGIAVMLKTAIELRNEEHKSDIYFSCTAREEQSGAGASSAAYLINPDIAIVVDVSHGSMPGEMMDNPIILGKGPEIPVGNRADNNLVNLLKITALEEGIPYQVKAMPNSSGNDTEMIQVARSGIPCVLVSIPLRYMHTPVEVGSVCDVNLAGQLIAAFIKKLDQKGLENVLCF